MISPSAVTGLSGLSALQPISAANIIGLLGSQASARPVRVGDRRTNERQDKQNGIATAFGGGVEYLEYLSSNH